MHPGWVDTAAVRRAMLKFAAATKWILRSPEQGADTISWLAGYDGSDVDQASGFWFDRKKAPFFITKRASVPPVEIQRMMNKLNHLTIDPKQPLWILDPFRRPPRTMISILPPTSKTCALTFQDPMEGPTT